jgi:integrase
MLIKCQECELQVSDKAISCPHCGFVLKGDVTEKRVGTSKHKRLPNGFGQISEIKNKRLRNRFRAMVPVGKTATGKCISKLLKPQAYFKTYNDAYAALLEYNKNPYDLNASISVSELYEKWTDEYFKTLKSTSSERTITSAWAYCSSVYDMRASDIRARHVKGCMEEGAALIKGVVRTPSAGVKARIKSLFNLMFDYALEYEIVDRNYPRTFNVSDEIIKEKEEAKRGHIIFTDDEIQKLWSCVDTKKYVDIVLIQCYSGWRPQELGLIRVDDTDLENMTFIGGIKTEFGKNRLVPIHPRILELVKKRYNEAVEMGSEYLINCTDGKTHTDNRMFTYDKYSVRFKKIRDELKLNPEHRAHDGRMHFITMAKKNGVDEYAIKYIVGHSINDVTEKVYTKREVDWIKDEIRKIK